MDPIELSKQRAAHEVNFKRTIVPNLLKFEKVICFGAYKGHELYC